MNRTIKETTVKRYHCDSCSQLEQYLRDFIDAYNFGRRLKTLKGLTPYEHICKTIRCRRIEHRSTQRTPAIADRVAARFDKPLIARYADEHFSDSASSFHP